MIINRVSLVCRVGTLPHTRRAMPIGPPPGFNTCGGRRKWLSWSDSEDDEAAPAPKSSLPSKRRPKPTFRESVEAFAVNPYHVEQYWINNDDGTDRRYLVWTKSSEELYEFMWAEATEMLDELWCEVGGTRVLKRSAPHYHEIVLANPAPLPRPVWANRRMSAQ